MQILRWVYIIASLIATSIELVEEPGNGAEKKKKAIGLIQEGIGILAEDRIIPKWLAGVFSNETFLGWLIDVMVSLANNNGFFAKTEAV